MATEITVWTTSGDKRVSVSEWALMELDGSDYERGALETAHAAAHNVSEAFARLCERLESKGVMTVDELDQILGARRRTE